MTETPEYPNERWPGASRALLQALHDWLVEDSLAVRDDRLAPRFDPSAQTEFLRRTLARAVVFSGPQVERRLRGLRRMEALLARQEEGYRIGVEGHLLGSIARAYPVSHRAMRLELRGLGVQRLVEVAEQVELGFWAAPYRTKLPRRDR